MATRERHHQDSNGNLGLFLPPPGSPSKWDLGPGGRPSWIRALPGSFWTTVFEWELGFGHVLRLEMPTLLRVAANGDRASLTGADAIRRAAGLRDVCRCDYDYIARHARVPADGRWLARAAAKQRVRDGRRMLNSGGVLPWVTFEDGRLPKRWWRERAFLDSLEEWQQQPLQDLPLNVARLAARAAGLAAGRLQRELGPAQALRVWRALAGS
jgi:hypothetical protein